MSPPFADLCASEPKGSRSRSEVAHHLASAHAVAWTTENERTKLDSKQKTELAARLATLSRNEVNKLYSQASGLRKLAQKRSQSSKKVSLDDIVLGLLHEEAPPPSRVATVVAGLVVGVALKSATVQMADGSEVDALLHGDLPSVGDEVNVGQPEGASSWLLLSIAPRRTFLSRPDVGNSHLERVIVANVDVVAIVVSVVSPPLHPRLIDRYLIAIQRGGAQPILCVNKVDLLPQNPLSTQWGGGRGWGKGSELGELGGGQQSCPWREIAESLAPYEALGIPIFPCSTETSEGTEAIREALTGKTAAFVGHSGVGKSSLLNALFPDLNLKVGEVMKGYGRGAHTTTSSGLFDFGKGTRLIDTPGIRSFGLGTFAPGELETYFPEFRGLSCRFSDCTHTHEPDCGVRRAAEEGRIHPARYDTYLRLTG